MGGHKYPKILQAIFLRPPYRPEEIFMTPYPGANIFVTPLEKKIGAGFND